MHEPGEILVGRYEVRAVIAHGPTTVTYAAIDLGSKRRVGVRHWPADKVGANQAIAELEREVQLGEQVANVHVPRYVEHFTIPSGSRSERYLVHDACEGSTLAAWAQARRRGESELRAAGVSLLRALDALHRDGFVHGRVCADEVLIRADGRLFLMGLCASYDARTGVAADLRAAGETLSVASRGGLSPRLREWLQRLLGAGSARGFGSASEALHALQALPIARTGNPWATALVAVAALLGASAAGYGIWTRVDSAAEAEKQAQVAPEPDLPPAISDTSFEPRPIPGGLGLRLTNVRSLSGPHSPVTSVAFDATGTRLLSGSSSGEILVWSVEDGQLVRRFSHGPKLGSAAFLGSQHVLSGAGKSARIWDAPSGQLLREMPADSRNVTEVCSARAGSNLVSTGWDGSIHVFDAETGTLLRIVQQPPRVYALAVDPLSEHVAGAGDDGIVRVFRFADGAPEVELKGHTKAVTVLRFLPDAQTLVSASNDRTIRLWDIHTGAQALQLSGHRAELRALAVDPTGKLLASGSKDGELRIWHVSDGSLAYSGQVDGRGVGAIAFSPDGQRIAVGGGSNRVDLHALVMMQASWRPPAITRPLPPPPLPLLGTSPAAAMVGKARALIASGAQGRPEAEVLLHQALALEPKNNDACLELARIDLEERRFDEAAHSARRCEQQSPGDARSQALLIEIAAAEKKDDLAIERAQALLAGDPDIRVRARVYAVLRQVYLRRGESDAAEEALRSEINLNPAVAQRKVELAELLIERERYDEAIGWARAALAQSDSPDGHVALGNALAAKARLALEAGKRGEFELWLARAFKADANSADGHYARALAYKRDRDPEAARRELRAALKTNPQHQAAAAALR